VEANNVNDTPMSLTTKSSPVNKATFNKSYWYTRSPCGLVVIGESRLEAAIEAELKHASKTWEKAIDARSDDLRQELEYAVDSRGA
jgi:hypothetical protein